ncbi:MAG: hypothetical protein EVB11_12940 [Winogradskyella sp.]|nr:MAG: hypothetical protein EVB11_12940 [Winogradskyella sp.]
MKKINSLILLIVSLLVACSDYGEKLEFNGTEVYYNNGITEAEATQLGDYLVAEQFANGTPKSVQLSKNKDSGNLVFRMVVNEGTAYDPGNDFMFKSFASNLNKEFETNIDFQLCDNTFKPLKTYLAKDLDKYVYALKTQVLYTPNVTKTETLRLADFLIKENFSDSINPKTIQLDKIDNVYLFRMVVKQGIADSESNSMILKLFGNSLSQNVFAGDSLRVQMCNSKMETIKDLK